MAKYGTSRMQTCDVVCEHRVRPLRVLVRTRWKHLHVHNIQSDRRCTAHRYRLRCRAARYKFERCNRARICSRKRRYPLTHARPPRTLWLSTNNSCERRAVARKFPDRATAPSKIIPATCRTTRAGDGSRRKKNPLFAYPLNFDPPWRAADRLFNVYPTVCPADRYLVNQRVSCPWLNSRRHSSRRCAPPVYT